MAFYKPPNERQVTSVLKRALGNTIRVELEKPRQSRGRTYENFTFEGFTDSISDAVIEKLKAAGAKVTIAQGFANKGFSVTLSFPRFLLETYSWSQIIFVLFILLFLGALFAYHFDYAQSPLWSRFLH